MKVATPPGTRLAPALAIVVLVVALGAVVSAPARAASANPTARPPAPFDPPLPRSPLAPPLVFKAGFGDFRGGHFHAGFDLGTSQQVGRPVRAPAAGWIERARTSGIGYGRSLYLHTADGRILQFGHLDAFSARVDAFVRHVQDSTGQYEQDLWLPKGGIRVKPGETIAWSGESGAGGPHLHFEIRRGDIAYNPLLAGLPSKDRLRPAILRLTLEPLDDGSLVAGEPGPKTIPLTGSDTLRAIGRLRAIVVARARSKGGAGGMVPWEIGLEWKGQRTSCRFDSVSWATDMTEADYVFDTGRVTGERGIVLWAPPGFRPRTIHADAPRGDEAGTIEIRPGDPPRTLRLWAREVDGAIASRRVVLRPGTPPEESSNRGWNGDEAWSDASAEFTSLPGGIIRVSLPASNKSQGLEIQFGDRARRASRSENRWIASFALPDGAASSTVRIPLAARAFPPDVGSEAKGGLLWARRASPSEAVELTDEAGHLELDAPAGALFEDAVLLAFAVRDVPALPANQTHELVPMSGAWQVGPSRLPLRKSVTIRLKADGGGSLGRVGLYRYEPSGWGFAGAAVDSTSRSVRGGTRELGRFALFRDELAPRAALLSPAPAPATKGAYSRWVVEASVTESGSGVDARASWLEVDGVRVPTEWDPEAGRLRWQPVGPPARGAHELLIVVADRAGNEARVSGHFRVGP